MKPSSTSVAVLSLVALVAASPAAPSYRLANAHLVATFDRKGMTSLAQPKTIPIPLAEGSTGFGIDGASYPTPESPRVKEGKGSLTYAFTSGAYRFETTYEIKPDWGFVSKRTRVFRATPGTYVVDKVDALTLALPQGTRARSAGGASAYLVEAPSGPVDLFVAQQNPFPVADTKAGLSLGYAPKMEWKTAYGPFETDRVLIGISERTGRKVALPSVPEWKYVADPSAAVAASPQVDQGAYDALRSCIDAFALVRPEKSLKVHIPWCENDYQIDLANADGPPQYERIIDQAKAVGCDTVLFTPQNSHLAKRSDSTDAWAWESLLWLGYGPKIRKGEWDVSTGPIHPSIQHFLDYAKRRDVRLLAYVYPTLAWPQDPAWTEWAKKGNLPLGGYVGADTANRGFQDWFVDEVVRFCDRLGLAGVSFDHWWIAYDQPTASSRYAQWYGCRRILEELRRKSPNMIIDGRQQYQSFGPWTWLAGSYPHPTSSDEQPVSFRAFADLHTDRVSADRQRYASYWYTVRNFTPPVLNPGYLTHQTQRNTPTGFTTEPFRVKDWDVLGWRYSVLSSVGTAPYNSVVSMIPARDPEEVAAFSAADKRWFADWVAWPDRHRDLIAHTRPILGQPMVGKVDGTSMIDRDHGFVFLFNPNYRAMTASLDLDGAIGLEGGETYAVRQVEPEARPLGVWRRGERLDLPMHGTSAVVLEILPTGTPKPLTVLDALGAATFGDGVLSLAGVRGAIGAEEAFRVALPKGAIVKEARVNGQSVPYDVADGVATLRPTFAGTPFAPAQPAIPYASGFVGRKATGTFNVPAWVKDQLARRKAAWPVAYSEDDLIAPWLGPDRLLLFVSIADANDAMMVSLTLDGKPYPLKKAYNSVYKETVPGTFIGFYADLGSLPAGVGHQIEVALPEGLAPGQFQGVYFDNVERELTDRVVPMAQNKGSFQKFSSIFEDSAL